MKKIIKVITVFSIFSSAYALDCLEGLQYLDRAEVLSTFRCSTIIDDFSEKYVNSADICFVKLKNQFKRAPKGSLSYAINGSVSLQDERYPTRIIASKLGVNYANGEISFAQLYMAPELMFQKTHYDVSYDTNLNTLSVKMKKGIFRLKDKFDLTLECVEQ